MSICEYMSAVDLADDIKGKKVSPVEVMDETIAIVEEREETLNAFTFTRFDEARAKAREAERRLMAGEAQGTFFGVPTAAKDFLPGVPGWPGSTGGVKVLSTRIDRDWGAYTGAMVKEGAILIGKTNAPAYAFRGTCDNKMYGPTSTPFKIGYNSGGSSGGSAAAVGDGMLLIAEGTDGGGSIRIPAAWCGCYGYKPSVGTVPSLPRPNAYSTSHPFCWDGSISRTVKDAAYALQGMAGFNPFDPFSIDHGDIDYAQALSQGVKGMKIGFTPDFDLFPVDPEIKAIVEKAARRFEELGASVETIDFDWKLTHYEYAEAWCRLISINGMEAIHALKDEGIDLLKDYQDQLNPQLIYWINDTYRRGYVDFNNDFVIRTECFDALQRKFQDHDLILSPTVACHPVENDPDRNTLGPAEINGERVEPLIGYCMTFFCNFAGHPAASIPAGLSNEGFPVGMQIIGKRFKDMDVLAASAAFETLQPWKWMYDITASRLVDAGQV